ncbi:MAG TPA: tripartite tricarboxylate transporter substrate binding protein [Xanthobacteraceae bacterium]|jgi:tripartite-type tricarboxylate transporter receptor subunit TctC|nr:tripartite tricarboxylate transporter substrate binding protein [Xanthobacteraceae bacterium]
MMSRRLFLSGAAAASLARATPAAAGRYPERLVKIIVAGLPGTPFDLLARAIADRLSPTLGQTFLVDPRPGAAGNVAAEFVAKSPADGYTLLAALGTTFTVNPSLYRKPPFDPLADFSFISIMATTATTLVVHPSIPVNSVAEFVAYAKKEPVAYAHGGNGTPGHLAMEYFRLLAGFKTLPVPYRGNPQLVADLVAGQIKFGFVGSSGVAQHIRAGRLKGLAISTRERSPLAPELPTIAESGYPEFEFDTYYVLAAPAGIPGRVAALLEREVLQVLASPDLQEKFRAQDTVIAPTSGAEAGARIKSDFQKWAKVVKAAGMHVD